MALQEASPSGSEPVLLSDVPADIHTHLPPDSLIPGPQQDWRCSWASLLIQGERDVSLGARSCVGTPLKNWMPYEDRHDLAASCEDPTVLDLD